MPLDPKAQGFLEMFAGVPALNEMSVTDARAGLAAMAAMNTTVDEVATIENRRIPGPAGEIAVRIYRPASPTPLPVVTYFHGGGWVVGDLDSHDNVCRALARRTPCVVVSVDYRLAPEHKFPAATEDCFAATRWVADNAAALGGDPNRLSVGGDSAGGNLSAVVALMTRDRGGPALRHQLLVYPVTDARCDSPSYTDNRTGYFLTAVMMQWFWNHYLRTPADGADPLASPLRAASLDGLPPALVITAEFDPLRDEGEAYGARLQAAGVNATVTRYNGVVHGFFGMTTVFNQAGPALDQAAAAIRAACA
jgi:acetyl esterase